MCILAVGLFLITASYGNITTNERSAEMKSAISTSNTTYSIVITETLFDYIGGKAAYGVLSVQDSQTAKPLTAEETFRTDNSDPPGGSFANNVKISTYKIPLGKKVKIAYEQPMPTPNGFAVNMPDIVDAKSKHEHKTSFVYDKIGVDKDFGMGIKLSWM
jgi:hypothetical protein